MQFVFDLDGTICFKGRPISETILCAIEQIEAERHEVIFASARPIRDMLPVLHERFHRHTLIGGNGALVSQQGTVTFAEAFTKEQAAALLQLITEHEATYLIDSDWDYAYTGPADHPILRQVDTARLAKQVDVASLSTYVKMLLLTATDMERLSERLSALDVIVHRHRNENVVDISPAGIHKWNALKQVGVAEQAFVAFGNDANDIPMFRTARHAVMIGHHDELAPYAAEVLALDEQIEAKVADKLIELARRSWQ
ncbi:HAD-IIB family hydrolase [Paenibacillus sp. GCM10027626]|uniref:HAD-IIB family hydrolase n=1 Tax=Paenibacillus sp. GCM10027626 TaxID=3273411 RepID=UPI00363257F3